MSTEITRDLLIDTMQRAYTRRGDVTERARLGAQADAILTLLAERDRQVAERAWDEGASAGYLYRHVNKGDEKQGPDARPMFKTNPHRADSAAPDEREALDIERLPERLPERFRFSRKVYGDVADDATRVLLALTDGGHADQPSDHLRWVSITAAQALATRPAPSVSAAAPDDRARVTAWNGWIDDHRGHGSVTRELMAAFDAGWAAAVAACPAPTVTAEAERDEARAALAACARGCVMCGSAFRALAAAPSETEEGQA